MNITRSKSEKWILQKNISSTKLIEEFLKVLGDDKKINQTQIKNNLKLKNGYHGRSPHGSENTMGVRLSQMCFYMFGYKSKNKTFIPTQSTINILGEKNTMGENMLINLFALQYPNPYSKTPPNFQIYAGRLILKLLTDERIDKKLYIDEFVWFLPFIDEINEKKYNQLIDLILDYRSFTFETKEILFKSVDNYEEIFSNCLHEINYYLIRIFESFQVFSVIEDTDHNQGKLFRFKHGKDKTYRNDAYASRKKHSGYVELRSELLLSTEKLLSAYSPFDKPISMSDPDLYSEEDLLIQLYEIDILNYLSVISNDELEISHIASSLNNMTYMSKYSDVSGKNFELSLKPVFELFREARNVEIISGSGNTDLLCAISGEDGGIYKINVDAKSRKSANNLNAPRLNRHVINNGSKYCIVVAPRFSKGPIKDISGYPIVTITAEVLALYCSKHCLTSTDYLADYTKLNKIILENLGNDITDIVSRSIENEFGIIV